MEQQTQKLLLETQLDITEFDNLLQPIIDTCTKDAISVGLPAWRLDELMFTAKTRFTLKYQKNFTLSLTIITYWINVGGFLRNIK